MYSKSNNKNHYSTISKIYVLSTYYVVKSRKWERDVLSSLAFNILSLAYFESFSVSRIKTLKFNNYFYLDELSYFWTFTKINIIKIM